MEISANMIRAIIFDFNGVIADDETPHIVCFQQALAEVGLSLTKDEYYGTYLGMDERTCARMLLIARDGTCEEGMLSRIAQRKAELFRVFTAIHKPALFPGVAEFVKAAKSTYRLAIASGGRREQIDAALSGTPIEQDFELIVSAEDCPIGKPDPAIYRHTCERLNAAGIKLHAIAPAHCLVIEDSLAGIRSAKAAGMRVLAVATTYPVDKLGGADGVLTSLHRITPDIAISRMDQTGQASRLSATQPR
jgi:HAD superfamily hydrolase (TIGR01509 family)